MKKQITLLLLIIIHLSAWSQKTIPTDGPCTEAMLLNIKGKWIKNPRFNTPIIKPGQQEAFNRLDQIHNMMVKIYPQPMGVDIFWHHTIGPSYFGAQRKYYLNPNKVLTFDYVNLSHLATFYYTSSYHSYYCVNDKKNLVMPGPTDHTPFASVMITANSIEGSVGGIAPDDSWTINGLPVVLRSPVRKEKWNGYEVQYPEAGLESRIVLIHRKGILPYIPVTRKQYLDYCIIFHSKLWDEMIKAQEQMPVRTLEEQEKEKKAKLAKFEKDFGSDPKRLKSAVDYYLSGYQTDQQRSIEQIEKSKKNKEVVLKPFRDELEKSAKEGLLDSPAVVLVKYNPSPVFETNPEKGYMLVTENPEYIRKDLPKYVPQVFVLRWSCNDHSQQKDIGRIIEENFSIEKLQAMIDQ